MPSRQERSRTRPGRRSAARAASPPPSAESAQSRESVESAGRRERGRWEDKEFVGSDEVETGATERLTFFSDAVAAIAMTLLAIELPVPDGETAQQFWHSVHQHQTEYFAFLISFAAIAAHWSSHHRVFRFVSRADNQLRLTNMVWLFAIVCIPFATRIITEAGSWDNGGAAPARFAVYSANQLLANGSMVVMLAHVQRKQLLRDDTPRILVLMSYWHAITMATGFLLSIPLFFMWHRAWILWFAAPIVLGSVGGRYFAQRARSLGSSDKQLDTKELDTEELDSGHP